VRARTRTARKGLSPLVATVLLISATVIGGMLVYQYFQSSVDKVQGLGGGVLLTAQATVLDDDTTLVKVTVVNAEDVTITLLDVQLLDATGAEIDAQPTAGTTLPTTLEPGEKVTLVFITNQPPKAALVQYEANGEVYVSDPVEVSA